MQIVGKSIINKEQLKAKQKYGINDIEIQLYGDEILKQSFNDLIDIIKESDINVVAVHAPLDINSFTEFSLEYLTNPLFSELFLVTCKFAQELADYYEHDINVIVHNGLCLEKYLLMNSLTDSIIETFDYVLSIYPNIVFSIENVLPFYFKNDNRLYCFDGFMYDNVDLANYLNEKCIRPAFFTTLDICHLLYSLKFLNLFSKESFSFTATVEDFFIKNKDTLNNIHFSNLKNWGYEKLDHGTCFDENNEQDYIFVENILKLYEQINLDATITLEVRETDYIKCDNFFKTLNCLNKIKNND